MATYAIASVLVDSSGASGTLTMTLTVAGAASTASVAGGTLGGGGTTLAIQSMVFMTSVASGSTTQGASSPPAASASGAGVGPSAPTGNVYRFATTDTLTGRVLADSLPIIGQSAQSQINSVGSFSGVLTLPSAGPTVGMIPTWVNAVRPWTSILWIFQNGTPIWNGPITAWNHQSIGDGTLPIQAASMEEFFKHRHVSDNLVFQNTDIFEIFRQELIYALGKKPNGNIAGTGRYADTAGIIDTVQYSGVIGSITEQDSLKKIYDCWNDLVSTYNLEYTLVPAVADAGSLFTQVRLGLPLLGRKFVDTQLQFIYPGRGILDYGWPWVPTSPVTRLTVTGAGGGSNSVSYSVVADDASTLNKYPLLEDSAGFNGTVTSQAQIQNYANGLVKDQNPEAWITPTFVVAGTGYPQVSQVQLGDQIQLGLTSPLHPADSLGRPGLMGTYRITGWSLSFPSGQSAEETQYTLGAQYLFAAQGG